MRPDETTLVITPADIERFGRFSHDANPLHRDERLARQTFFGTTIAHGALTIIRALETLESASSKSIRHLDAEFRRPIYPNSDYGINRSEDGSLIRVHVQDDSGDALILKITSEDGLNEPQADAGWLEELTRQEGIEEWEPRAAPADRDMASFQQGESFAGLYRTDRTSEGALARDLPANVVNVLALCSYVIGMESPGLKSLFTRLSLTFEPKAEASPDVAYQVKTSHVDARFRMIKNDISVCSTQGQSVAWGELRSYVRFTPVRIDPDKLRNMVAPAGDTLKGKTALVVGGSRGLGAELCLGLALAGCHVYAGYFSSGEAVLELEALAQERGLDIRFKKGDAADRAWCEAVKEDILAEHGRLDALILNAATAPAPLHVGSKDQGTFGSYIQTNLKLVHTPLAVFLPAVQESKGLVCAVSSSFVTETPKEFPHYVALKQAVEGLISASAKGYPDIAFLLPRPPRLQTSWNDTPSGVLGTVPVSRAAAGIVNAMAEPADEQVRIVTSFPEPEPGAEPDDQQEADYHVVVAANFTSDLIIPGLRFWFKELEINGEAVIAPYNQILQELINPNSLLCTNAGGVSVVLIRIQDWLRELDSSTIHSKDTMHAFLDQTAQEFIRAVKTHRGQCKVETMVVFCPADESRSLGYDDVLDKTRQHVIESLEGMPGLTVVNADEYHETYGLDTNMVYDPLREKIGHIPYQKSYYHFLATLIIRNVYRKMVPLCKVVVVDCDNTLWNGVVGEVGAEGLHFESSHIALQQKLNQLSKAGIVVSLCSKNEEFDVWSVFDTRPDFVLKRENIVSSMINWQPKSENIKKLASRINLGLDSFVFIDDNPVECAEVKAACPEVLTIQWPKEAEKGEALLKHIWELDVKKGTEVDQKRTQMYKEELKRQEFMEEKVDFGEFIKSLELKTDLRDLNDEDLPRASQLTMRTNQFNFTTRRRKEGELKALMADDDYVLQTVRVRDRFGDYGLVGFYIAKVEGGELIGDTFLLSCRVLGRGVEHYMLSELGRFAHNRGLPFVRLEVFPTPRNTPARDFLKSVSPEEHCHIHEDGGIVAVLPSEDLMSLEFVPTEEESSEEEAQGPAEEKQEKKDSGNDAPNRSREQQITRAAFELSDMAGLTALIHGQDRPGADASISPRSSLDSEEVGSAVYEVFAQELNLSTQRIQQLDSLADIGCDSFKIVEITVVLIQKFPWLPETLLFEHRCVSDIVEHIKKLAAEGFDSKRGPGLELSGREPGFREPTGDIAVIGVGVRCAGADSREDLWEMLATGRSGLARVSSDREYFLGRLNDDLDHWAGLMNRIDGFDADFFGISPREASLMDPQVRLFLETSWEALEDAGCVGGDFEPETGVYAGVMYSDYTYRANQDANQDKSVYRSWESFSLANRLSHFMGFRGPSFSVDTACSSSGTALHLACNALRNRECRMAVVGGVNLILDPNRFDQLSRLGILSPSGKCRPFGDEADGVLLGEGVGVVVLKPLTQALDDHDRIYGVIKGTALSSGTGSIGFTAPNPTAQALAIGRSIRDAGIDPRTVSYVETHGTGTPLGDPIEVRGLMLGYGERQLWDQGLEGEQSCAIGSIKPNIGHLESGAGILGLIKVLLQFEHGRLVPSITSKSLSAKIPFADSPFAVQQGLAEWERPCFAVDGRTQELPRRAGVSSFGVGGANAHIIVEEPCAETAAQLESEDPAHEDIPLHVLTLSATGRGALEAMARRIRDHVKDHPELNPRDVCFTLSVGRRHFANRLACVVSDRDQLLQSLDRCLKGETPAGCFQGQADSGAFRGKTAFLFTGQGAQYPGMASDLYHAHPVVQEALDECASILDAWLERPLLEVLLADPESPEAGLIDQTLYTQLGLFAVEYALSRLWASWGVRPDAVIGHSLGELVALTFAGVLSLEDGLRLVHARAKMMQALPGGGKMAAVRLSEQAVSDFLKGYEDEVAVASVNAPDQVVISGRGDSVDAICTALEGQQVDTTALQVSHAFHSPLIEPMLEEYLETIDSITVMDGEIPVVSCVDGSLLDSGRFDSAYWRRQVREPVRFMEAMESLDSLGVTTFVEVGPHPVLLGMGSLCLPYDDRVWLPSMRRKADAFPTLYESVARLYVHGADIDWKGFHAYGRRRKVDLPTYAFQHERYWLQPTLPEPRPKPVRSARNDLAYEVRWEPKPYDPEIKSLHPEGTWLIFMDRQGLGEHVAAELKWQQQHCICVQASPRFEELSDGHFAVNPEESRDMEQLWQRVLESRGTIKGLVFLWGLDVQDNAVFEQQPLSSILSRTLSPVLNMAQQALSLGEGHPPALWVGTWNATGADGRPGGCSLAQAMLWGFGRSLALEHPELWGGLVDISPELDAGPAAESIVKTMLRPDGEDQVFFGPEGRLVPRLQPTEADTGAPFQCDARGTYLLTGGFGALGRQVAAWLVDHGARRLVLVSRKGWEAAEAAETVRALEKQGAQVEVAALDVTGRQAVNELMQDLLAREEPLKGIVHLAGLEEHKPVPEMRAEDIERVAAPKVEGAWLLHELSQDADLDMFVCFSSMASVTGAEGRSHYGAANAALDALVQVRGAEGLPGLSVNWGPWKGGGMAGEDDLKRFERIGNHGLEPKAGLDILEKLLSGRKNRVMVADIDWSVFLPFYEARSPRPLVEAFRAGSDEEASAHGQARAPWLQELDDLPPEERPRALTEIITRNVAQVLGASRADDVSPDMDFKALGMDSLMAVELSLVIQKGLGLGDRVVVYDYPTVSALVRDLLSTMRFTDRAGSRAGSEDAREAVVGYEPELEGTILEFYAKAWPNRKKELIEPRWRWMFLDSAARLGVEPRMWNAFDNGTLVGFTGAIPVKVKVGDAERLTSWFVDTMVLESCRNWGLGPMIMMRAREEQNFNLSLGQTREMRTILFKLGWQQVAPFQTYVYPLRPGRMLKGKLNPIVAGPTGAGLQLRQFAKQVRVQGKTVTLQTRLVDEFEFRHDQLWHEVKGAYPCAVVRDSSYLNWKYVHQPGQDYVRMEMLDQGKVVAVAVLLPRDPADSSPYQYRRAFVVDLVVSPSDKNLVLSVLECIRQHCLQLEADAVVFELINEKLEAHLQDYGFIKRDPMRFFLVYTEGSEHEVHEKLMSSSNWLVTKGDSDVDRPEGGVK